MTKKAGMEYLNNIKAERARKGLTQVDMAKRLGMSETTYIFKENGRRQFTINELMLIAVILGTDPETLLKTS